jgi:hypothetical protein
VVPVVALFAPVEVAITADRHLAVEAVGMLIVGVRVERAVEIVAIDGPVTILIHAPTTAFQGCVYRISVPLNVRSRRSVRDADDSAVLGLTRRCMTDLDFFCGCA